MEEKKPEKKTDYPPMTSHVLLYQWYKEGVTSVAELNDKLAKKTGSGEVFPPNIISFCINEGAKAAGDSVFPIKLEK
ncbi:MAG: hypothetical protein WC878_00615 [Candidatus Paceibacterota bacterium]|jgi:hypothetical protein